MSRYHVAFFALILSLCGCATLSPGKSLVGVSAGGMTVDSAATTLRECLRSKVANGDKIKLRFRMEIILDGSKSVLSTPTLHAQPKSISDLDSCLELARSQGQIKLKDEIEKGTYRSDFGESPLKLYAEGTLFPEIQAEIWDERGTAKGLIRPTQ